jgi:hypothetical protein
MIQDRAQWPALVIVALKIRVIFPQNLFVGLVVGWLSSTILPFINASL